MPVILDALDARHGDALLLHFGAESHQKLWLIDGGPSGTYAEVLRPRLQNVRRERQLDDDAPLVLDLVVISHVDDDHVHGVLDLLVETVAAQDRQQAEPYRVKRIWHNSIDAVVETSPMFAVASSLRSVAEDLASASQHGVDVASIQQGSKVADKIRRLDLGGNLPFGCHLVAGLAEEVDGAQVSIISPPAERLHVLLSAWNSEMLKARTSGEWASVAAVRGSLNHQSLKHWFVCAD